VWMTTSEMGFPVTQERGEVQSCRDIVECPGLSDRVVRFLAPEITDCIREVQDKRIGGEGSHMFLPDLETLNREWNQGGRHSSNYRGRKQFNGGVVHTTCGRSQRGCT
jgi:hypothetical protein